MNQSKIIRDNGNSEKHKNKLLFEANRRITSIRHNCLHHFSKHKSNFWTFLMENGPFNIEGYLTGFNLPRMVLFLTVMRFVCSKLYDYCGLSAVSCVPLVVPFRNLVVRCRCPYLPEPFRNKCS